MKSIVIRNPRLLCLTLVLALTGCSVSAGNAGSASSSSTTTGSTVSTLIASLQPYADTTGAISTYNAAGIDSAGVFFQPLGSNGRTCASCHQLAQGMSLTPSAAQALFTSSSGTDPLFNAVDGANCPNAAAGDQAARSLLLNNGLIRIAITVPATAQFSIKAISDSYGCAITVNSATGAQTVSVYRRPLPATGVEFLSNVMWDTRETIQPLTAAGTFAANLNTDLTQQAIDAVATHAQGTATPTAAQTSAVIALMEGLYTAQATDSVAGSFSVGGATGGAANLAAQNYYPGINDAFGQDPIGARFNPNIFNLYAAWQGSSNAQQASIARGEQIFNTAPMLIANVRGINDNPALGSPATLNGSCGTCHDAPNVGSHSLPLAMDTAVARIAADETDPGIVNGLGQLSAPSLPVYQITGCLGANGQPVVYTTSDPGHALVSGLCADVNRVKLPGLRGLAARAPYFHNGSAANLTQLVGFYNARFNMHLNPQQQADLVNFLNAL
jgi:cytochrome c peroxidase